MIACLFLAYDGASVLRNAIPVLKAAGWDLFVHLDKKADRAKYEQELGEMSSSVHLIEDRVEVFWGGYSMIKAELALLQTAMRTNDYSKFLLLSDDSFPILPPDRLNAHFGNGEDLITIAPQPPHSPFYSRYHGFFCYDHPTTAMRSPPGAGRNEREIDENLEHRIAEIEVLRRIGKKNIEVYYGSQFWALTLDTVKFLVNVCQEDLHLVKSFEYSALPDETMVQSLIGNYRTGGRHETGPVYADFSVGGPRVLSSQAELPLDFQDTHAFVRKISPQATEFMEQMLDHLRAGRTILGSPPGERRLSHRVTLPEGDRVFVRLAAPAEDHIPGWNPIESFWGRKYRWTASDRIAWGLKLDGVHKCTVRFVITTVVGSNPKWMERCTLSFNGRTEQMKAVGGELMAEFEYNGGGALHVLLETPPLKSPRETSGKPDDRKLGLSIAL
jgi:hypothetical protein